MIQRFPHAYGVLHGTPVSRKTAEGLSTFHFPFWQIHYEGYNGERIVSTETAFISLRLPFFEWDWPFSFFALRDREEADMEQWLVTLNIASRYAAATLPERARAFIILTESPDAQEAARVIAAAFVPENVRVAFLPADARPTADLVEEACRNAAPLETSEGVFSARDMEKEYVSCVRDNGGRGKSTGIAALDEFYTVAPGEMTLLTGYPNQGKSELADQLAVNLWRADGGGTAFFSPENKRGDHIRKIVEKVTGKPVLNMGDAHSVDGFLTVADAFYWICPEKPTIGAIISRAEALARTGKISRLVIDPYNEIVQDRLYANESETEYVSRMLSEVKSFAKRRNVHVWFVAHPRKPEGAEKADLAPPGLSAISGSQHWVNKADNGLVVARGEHGRSKIFIRKIRNKRVGKIGECVLAYDLPTGIFSDPPQKYSMG